MTHAALIASALLLFLFDDLLGPGGDVASPPGLNAAALAGLVLVPKLVVAGWVLWRGHVAAARLGGARTARAIRWSNRSALVLPLAAVALFAGDLALGVLPRVRARIGNPVLLDELIVWIPTLLLLLAGQAARYPSSAASVKPNSSAAPTAACRFTPCPAGPPGSPPAPGRTWACCCSRSSC